MKHCQICNAYFDAPMVREGTDPTVFPGYHSLLSDRGRDGGRRK